MSSDIRQAALDSAVRTLRDSGAVCVSVLATWADKDTRTVIYSPKPDREKALGRGLSEIRMQVGTERVIKTLRGK